MQRDLNSYISSLQEGLERIERKLEDFKSDKRSEGDRWQPFEAWHSERDSNHSSEDGKKKKIWTIVLILLGVMFLGMIAKKKKNKRGRH